MSAQTEAIHEAAVRLFSTRGYQAASMRDIAEAVGLQVGSLYAHIDSKQSLLFDIVMDADRSFLGVAEAVLDRDGSVLDRLRDTARRHVEFVTDNRDRATVFFHEWRALDDAHRRLVVEGRLRYERRLAEVLEEGVRSGELRSADTRMAARALLGLLNSVYIWYEPEGPLDPEGIAEALLGIILVGLLDTGSRTGTPTPV